MRRLDAYIMRHIFELTGLSALALLAIYTFVSFVSDIGDVKGDYGIFQLLLYTLLMMPTSLYILMPIVALLGTLLGVGALARQNELTAMRAAGVSLLRIGTATLMAGVLLGIATFVLGDWLAPTTASAATAMRDKARGVSSTQARWLRDGDNMVQIRELLAEDRVNGVTVFQLTPDHRIAAITTADSAEYRDDHWHLNDVRQTTFADDRIAVTAQPALEWNGGLKPNVLKLFILESDSLSMRGLLKLIDYLHANRLDYAKYELLLWRKLVEPLTVMAMMLFAVPFVLGRARDTGAGQRLLIGVLVGIVFYVVNKVSLSYGALYQWPAVLSASGPTVLLAAGAAWWLRRTR